MRTVMDFMETAREKELRKAVVRQFEWDPEIDFQDISVKVDEGVVTLTGFVHSYAVKVAAEKAAKSVYGVRIVANDIDVKPTRTDPEIARDAVEAMRLDMRVPDDCIKAGISDGWVTLEGAVEWNYQREAADSCVKRLYGVRGVTNHIEVKSKVSSVQVSSGEVKTKVEDALWRSAGVDARRITVSSQDGAVILQGNVRSWLEKEEAARVAWAAPGVTCVVDDIAVVP